MNLKNRIYPVCLDSYSTSRGCKLHKRVFKVKVKETNLIQHKLSHDESYCLTFFHLAALAKPPLYYDHAYMCPEALEEVIRTHTHPAGGGSVCGLSINAPAQLHQSQRKTKRKAAVLRLAKAVCV